MGDVWAYGTSPLELQNAETKRVAADVGATSITFNGSGVNATSMSRSTFTHLLSAQALRAGEGDVALPDSRRKERVFGQGGSGRMTTHCVKDEHRRPSDVTCIEASVELMEAPPVCPACSQ